MVPPIIEEQVVCEDNGAQILFRTGAKTPPLESVAIEDWCLANSRIMFELLECGALDITSVKDYIAYTVKICDLFRNFERVSVLHYDREYRHLQSAYLFRWGTDTPHLYHTCLRPKSLKPRSANYENVRGHKGPELCKLYNTLKGCHYGGQCKFIHACSEPGCHEYHSRAYAHAVHASEPINPKA